MTARTKTAIMFAIISALFFAAASWHDYPDDVAAQHPTAVRATAPSGDGVGQGAVAPAAPLCRRLRDRQWLRAIVIQEDRHHYRWHDCYYGRMSSIERDWEGMP